MWIKLSKCIHYLNLDQGFKNDKDLRVQHLGLFAAEKRKHLFVLPFLVNSGRGMAFQWMQWQSQEAWADGLRPSCDLKFQCWMPELRTYLIGWRYRYRMIYVKPPEEGDPTSRNPVPKTTVVPKRIVEVHLKYDNPKAPMANQKGRRTWWSWPWAKVRPSGESMQSLRAGTFLQDRIRGDAIVKVSHWNHRYIYI